MTSIQTCLRISKEGRYIRDKDYYLIQYRAKKETELIQSILQNAQLKIAEILFTPTKVKV